MVIVVILLVALPMIFLGDNSISEKFGFKMGKHATSSGVKLSTGVKDVTTDTPVQIYRWRDEHGVLQFSNTPPVGVAAETLDLKPNLSSMDPVKPPPEEKQPDTAAAATSSGELGNPYTPGGMKQIIEQANELKKVISKQQEEQEKAIDQMLPKKH